MFAGNSAQVQSDVTDPAASGQIDLVILDFDGVVADSEVISLSSLQYALDLYGMGLNAHEVRRRYLGKSLSTIMQDVETQSPRGNANGFRETWHEVLFARFEKELQPVPGIDDFLDRLSGAGTYYCIASSSSFERLDFALGLIGLADRFEHIFSAQLVKHGKPAPDLFLHAAAELGVEASNCLVIEDSPYGIMAAKAAGMRSIGFLGGTHHLDIKDEYRKLLLDDGADDVVSSFEEVALSPRAPNADDPSE